MGHQIRVSIIIVTFNRSHYLRQAIASVLAQTFLEFEVLVVDDGSSDDTASVVTGFSDERITYIYQQNAGRSTARNRGLAHACGEYIAFLDDDDLYFPNKLAIQVGLLDSHAEIGLVSGGAQLIAADGSIVGKWEGWKRRSQISLPDCLYACPLLTCGVLLRRQWIDALDHWFDPEMDRAEDTDLWIRLLLLGCQMTWTPHIVSAYRQHPYNSQGDAIRYLDGYLKLLDKLFERADLPELVRAEKSTLYAHFYFESACFAYAGDHVQLAQAQLLHAYELAPERFQGNSPPFVDILVRVAHSDNVADPLAMIESFFENLTAETEQLRAYHRYAFSAFYMRRVFKANAAGGRPRFGDWLLGVYRYPRWLTNRGVWSILLKTLGGQNAA